MSHSYEWDITGPSSAEMLAVYRDTSCISNAVDSSYALTQEDVGHVEAQQDPFCDRGSPHENPARFPELYSLAIMLTVHSDFEGVASVAVARLGGPRAREIVEHNSLNEGTVQDEFFAGLLDRCTSP